MLSISFILFAIGSIIVNAVLTGQFGWQFCGGIFGALLMLMFFDVAAISWYVARMQSGLSATQRGIAKMMSVFTIIGSTLISVIQMLLTTNMVDLTAWHDTIGIAGVWLITITAAVNFIALFAFQYSSISERLAEQEEELAAQAADQRHEMINEAHERAMKQAKDRLMQQTDRIARRLAADAEREYLNSMGCLDLYQAPAEDVAPVAPTPPQQEAVGPDEFLEEEATVQNEESGEPLDLRIFNRREEENIAAGRNSWEDKPEPAGN